MAKNFHDSEDRCRFELDVDGSIAFVTYRKSPHAITLVHTEVPPEQGGRGIGSKLGRKTLDVVRAQGRELTGIACGLRKVKSHMPGSSLRSA